MSFFARISGLDRLAQAYPAAEPPQGTRLDKQTVQIGPVRFRRCVAVRFSDEGLYLEVRPPLGRALSLRVPWTEITTVKETRIYWGRAMLLSAGRPEIATIAVQMDLFDRFQPYLKGKGPRS